MENVVLGFLWLHSVAVKAAELSWLHLISGWRAEAALAAISLMHLKLQMNCLHSDCTEGNLGVTVWQGRGMCGEERKKKSFEKNNKAVSDYVPGEQCWISDVVQCVWLLMYRWRRWIDCFEGEKEKNKTKHKNKWPAAIWCRSVALKGQWRDTFTAMGPLLKLVISNKLCLSQDHEEQPVILLDSYDWKWPSKPVKATALL